MIGSVGRVVYVLARPLFSPLLSRTRRSYVLVRKDSRVLAVKNVIGSGKWHMPGGGCERGETFSVAASRELFEETGLSIEPGRLIPLHTKDWRSEHGGYTYRVFDVTLKDTPPLRLRKFEIADAQWVEATMLDEANCSVDMLRAVDRIKNRDNAALRGEVGHQSEEHGTIRK